TSPRSTAPSSSCSGRANRTSRMIRACPWNAPIPSSRRHGPSSSSTRIPGSTAWRRWTSPSAPGRTGNIAAILAGTPAVMLAHDSRTLELARYHGIPSLVRGADGQPGSVQELFSHADFTEFNRGHAERFETLSRFIHDNGFSHIYDPGPQAAQLG